jgi:hypothetical protein
MYIFTRAMKGVKFINMGAIEGIIKGIVTALSSGIFSPLLTFTECRFSAVNYQAKTGFQADFHIVWASDMSSAPYFHGIISREEGEQRLMATHLR